MDKKSNIITPKELFNDIVYVNKKDDTRLMILYLYLYIEYYAHKLYGEARKLHRLKDEKLSLFKKLINYLCRKKVWKMASLKTKIKKLIEYEIVDDMYLGAFTLINNLRQELIHNLTIDTKKLESWINGHDPPVEGKNKESIKQILNSISSWDRIQIFVIPAIIHFYQKLKEARNEKVDYQLAFHIDFKNKTIKLILE